MTSIPLILFARVLHVVAGILWAGAVFVLVWAVMPIARQHAKDGAERWTALITMKVGPISGIAALLTVLSGGFLMAAMHPGDNSISGWILRIGAFTGVLALLIGLIYVRPLAMKLARSAADANDPAMQQAREQMRRRAAAGSKTVAALVAIAVLCMALFRYVPMLI